MPSKVDILHTILRTLSNLEPRFKLLFESHLVIFDLGKFPFELSLLSQLLGKQILELILLYPMIIRLANLTQDLMITLLPPLL